MKHRTLLIIAVLATAQTFAQITVDKVMKDQPVFDYIDADHTREINETMASAVSTLLKRDSRLDTLALIRCLRYVKFIVSDTRYVDDTAFIKKEIHNGFTGLFKSENSARYLLGAGFTEKQFLALTPSLVSPKI